LFVCCGLMRY